MALTKFNRRTVSEDSGAIIAGATVTFYNQESGSPVAVYEDVDGDTSLGNSVLSEDDGSVPVFMTPGVYRITVESGGNLVDDYTYEAVFNTAFAANDNSVRTHIFAQKEVPTYSAALDLDPNDYLAGETIYIYGDGIAGNFVVTTGAIPDSSTGVQLSNATWNAAGKHLKRLFDNEIYKSVIESYLTTIGSKPDFSVKIKDKVFDRVAQPFSFRDARSLGGRADSIVLGNIKNHQGVYISADPYLLIYVPSANTDAHTFELYADELVGGADDDNITAKIVKFNSLGGTFVDDSTMTKAAGGRFTGSATGDGTSFYGIQIEYTPTDYSAGELLAIRGISITTGGEEQISPNVYKNVMCSIVANNNINARAYVTEDYTGFSMTHYGVQCGSIPRALYVSVSGGKNVPTDLSFTYAGNSIVDKLNYISASAQQRVIAGNGLEPPAIIFEPGEYDLSSQAGVYLDGGSIITEAIYACPDGEAQFNRNATNHGVIRCATDRSATGFLNLYLWNITSDDQHPRPTIFQTCNIYALGCKINGADTDRECWEMLTCNYYLQECEARNAGNDGFNLHDYLGLGAHGVLVDCISEDNGDDGFSPHENTTFQVWGGTYQNNGKANIIPAFQAKGFCVGVSSAGATGLSPRVVDTNWGGFVALSADTNNTDTVLWCINCDSDGDTYGYNSAGDHSHIYFIGSESINNTAAIINAEWESVSSGQSGGPGHIVIYDPTYSNNTSNFDLEDDSRVRWVLRELSST